MENLSLLQRAVPLLLEWYRVCKRTLPWRGTHDPYKVWVSEIMLQQTRVEAVKDYYVRFLQRFPTAEALAAAVSTLRAPLARRRAETASRRRARELPRAEDLLAQLEEILAPAPRRW